MADHAFGWGQLVYAGSGVARVSTRGAEWVLPAPRALWVPPGVRHRLHCITHIDLCTLYFAAGALPALPDRCTVVEIGPLLRQLVLSAVSMGPVQTERAFRLHAVLMDELAAAAHDPTGLPLPTEPGARRVAKWVMAHPGSRRSIEAICRRCGMARRSTERAFRSQTGISLGQWRRRARLQHALVWLAEGLAVSEVAERVGYESASAFGAAFRTTFGRSPRRYFEDRT